MPSPPALSPIQQHRARLVERIETARASAESARQGTRVDGDHRPASRGERGAVSAQAALRAGLLERRAALEMALAQLDALPSGPRTKVGAGARVCIAGEDEVERWFLILPGGDGQVLQAAVPVAGAGEEPVAVTVISPSSPIAQALVGLEEGDEATLRVRGEELEAEVVWVG